ncbi:putative quinol monooxygenase [Runella zeae]|uniref:putative quinol monooxygenase n=1 Tax=Runella zeae TaxID=94255 RepID=UPI0023554BFF|nr:antibiotic biosynthesis monooxygenase [Runella zeae]
MKPYILTFQNRIYKTAFLFLLTIGLIFSYRKSSAQQKEIMVRLSEIEIFPADLEEYRAILKEEAAASVKLEPGVLSIFPMYQKESPTQIRILEIYANREAYESHLKSPHFQHYKTSTLKMVKSLRLIDMSVIDSQTMAEIFRKLK